MASILSVAGGCAPGNDLLPYEPEVVELEGVLEREHRYGPPNYGESPEIDRSLTVYTFSIREPIDVGRPDTLSEVNDSPVREVSKVHVVVSDEACDADLEIGKTVRLRGALSKQTSGHHFYPVLFSLEPASLCDHD